jgi:hemerythrin-like domain-containing protein
MKSEYESYALGLRLSHAALMRNLDRFVELSVRDDFEHLEDLAAFVALYAEFLDLHHRSEEDHIFSALRGSSAGKTTDAAHLDRWSAEHRDIDQLGRGLAEIAERLPRRRSDLKELGRASRVLRELLAPHTASEEEVLSATHLPEMISERELKATTSSIARANRSRALSMASFLASSLQPSEQRALLGEAPWFFRKLFLGVIGARRMRRFQSFVQTSSIAV